MASAEASNEYPVVGAPPFMKQPLVGRDELLNTVRQALLGDADVGIYSGLPGAGKTAIAATLARDPELHAHFRDGVLWAGLGPDEKALRSKLERWGEELGLDRSAMDALSDDALSGRINDEVGERRFLLIIDDAWSVADARRFWVGGDHPGRLLTSRYGDVVEAFATECHQVQELESEPGLELLRHFAPKVVDESPNDARKVVRSVGGLPLGVVVIGSYLRKAKTPSQRKSALAEVLDGPWVLDAPLGSLPEKVIWDSLNGAIAFSEARLDDEALKRAFHSLTVFPPKINHFAAEAAERVIDSTRALQGLADHGLVDVWDETLDRFTMHQAVWEYARKSVDDPDAYRRMAEYFIEFIDRHDTTDSGDAWLADLEGERENMRAALDYCVERKDAATALNLAGKMFRFWYERSHFEDGRRRAEEILALKGAQDPSLVRERAKLINDHGNFLYSQGHLPEAEKRYEEALELREGARLEADAAGSYNNVALIARARGDYEGAERRLEKALEINRRIDRRDWEGKNLNNLGIVALLRGDLERAAKRQLESKAVFAELKDRWGVAMALCDLGRALLAQHNLEAARAACAESLEIRRDLQDAHGMAAALRALAAIDVEAGDLATARHELCSALEHSAMLKDEHGAAEGLAGLAIFIERKEHPEHAAALLGAVHHWRVEDAGVDVPRAEEDAASELASALGEQRFDAAWSSRQSGPLCDLIPIATAYAQSPGPSGGSTS